MHTLYHLFVLLTAVLLPVCAHAESLTFRSEVTATEFNATIRGELSLPKGKGPFPVVILLHPCGGLDEVALMTLQSHSRELLSSGFGTLILDSYGPRNLNGGKMCSSRFYSTDIRYGLRRDDAFNAMVALERHANISKDNIFLLGLSDSASAGVLSATGRPTGQFRGVASYYPDCGKLFSGRDYVFKSPIIVFVGEKDDWTPPNACIKAKSSDIVTGAELEVISYPNAYHGFDQPRPMRKVFGYTMAYDRDATIDSRKKYIAFFIKSLTPELKAAPGFVEKTK